MTKEESMIILAINAIADELKGLRNDLSPLFDCKLVPKEEHYYIHVCKYCYCKFTVSDEQLNSDLYCPKCRIFQRK